MFIGPDEDHTPEPTACDPAHRRGTMVDRNLSRAQACRETLRGPSLAAYSPWPLRLVHADRGRQTCVLPLPHTRSSLENCSTSGRRLSASVALAAGMGEPGVMNRDGTVTKRKLLDQRDRVLIAGRLVGRGPTLGLGDQ
jgi:hypothetical protein